MQCAVGRVITEQRIPYIQTFPGFLLNFSFSRKTGPTSWHLPTLLPFFFLIPSPPRLQHPTGHGRQSGPWPLEALGSGSRGASPQQAGPANSSIQVFVSDVRSLGCPDEKSSLDKLLALCSQAALGFLFLQVAVSESRDQRSETVVLDFFQCPLGKGDGVGQGNAICGLLSKPDRRGLVPGAV